MKSVLTCAAALSIDALLGDPSWLHHPVVLMGGAIEKLEHKLRARLPKTADAECAAGGVLVLSVAGGSFVVARTALFCAGRIHPAVRLALETLWTWQCVAMRDLWKEAANVQLQLEYASLTEARSAVARIVGRDVTRLNEQGVIRAAVESVAESFSDGVVAPLIALYLGGAPLALCYKAINTMDSMIGYKNEQYLHFGRVAAHTDDIANLIPSRLAALLLIGASRLCGEDTQSAWRIWRRDRLCHASPNSAQSEAAMAGALGIRLGGPAWYFGTYHEKPTIGDATRKPQPSDIGRASKLMCVGSVLCIGLIATAHLAAKLVGHQLRRVL